MSIEETQKAIISAIIFFDMFDYPLTEEEILQFCYFQDGFDNNDCGLENIKKILASEILSDKIEKKNDFYFLRGREEIIKIRAKRNSQSAKKFRKAKFIIRIFAFFSFINMAAVVNFMPSSNGKKDSDIDLFIIVKESRIWLTRIICAGICQVFGLRPTEKNIKDKICLSFFISDDNLDLRNIVLDKNDIYFYYWFATVFPIYNKDEIYEKFISTNSWIKNYLPNFQQIIPDKKQKINFKFSISFLYNFDFLERLAKKIQLKILSPKLREMANKDTRVIINDKMLKFHSNDRREYYQKKYKFKITNYK